MHNLVWKGDDMDTETEGSQSDDDDDVGSDDEDSDDDDSDDDDNDIVGELPHTGVVQKRRAGGMSSGAMGSLR
jgi:hypothetical protein